MTDRQSLLVAASLAVCLIAGSTPRLVGDGGEYLAQAIQFASFRGPSLQPADIPSIQARIGSFEPMLAEWQISDATIAGADGRRDFLHFWFYALLAAPALWVTDAVGAPPTIAFAVLNLALFLLALWVALPRIGAAAAVLLFGSPIVWWLDKAHTEVFTFALLTIAFVLLRERPWWSMIAAGAASTQNPPIAVLVPLFLVIAVVRSRHLPRDWRIWVGFGCGVVLAALHPAYTYARHGTPSLLLRATRSDFPTATEIAAVVFDPSIGLIGNFPIFLCVIVIAFAAVIRRRFRPVARLDVLVAVIAAGVFLFSFARTPNVHHGATPSLSRYALWLIPLGIPFLAAIAHARRLLWSAALASALISVFAFHPGVPQYSREPTWLASFLWTKLPAWHNPLPEVFIEVQLGSEIHWLPTNTPGCEKILIGGRGAGGGVWPMPCYPTPLPESCRAVGAVCYANLAAGQYRFAPAPGPATQTYPLRRDAVWPAGAEPHVRRLYDDWEWWRLPRGDTVSIVRQVIGAQSIKTGDDHRFIMVVRGIEPGARVLLRPAAPMVGVLMDPLTGATIAPLHHAGQSGERWEISLPAGFDLLVLALRSETTRSN
jgi:hypothetical protein